MSRKPVPGPLPREWAGLVLALLLAVSSAVAAGDRQGKLRLASEPPGAAVLFDGHEIARTPVAGLDLLEGGYPLVLRLDGFKDLALDVLVRAGKVSDRTVRLEPLAPPPPPPPPAAAVPVPVPAPVVAAVEPAVPQGTACERFRRAAGIEPSADWRLMRLECPEAEALLGPAVTGGRKLDLAVCVNTASVVRTLLAAAGPELAFSAWETRTAVGRASASAPGAGPRGPSRAAQFAKEYAATRTDLAGARGLDLKALPGRALLGASGMAATWDPAFEDALCSAGLKLVERASGAHSWAELASVAPALAWLDRFLRAAPEAVAPNVVADLLKASGGARYPDRKAEWAGLAEGRSLLLKAVARKARELGIADLASAAVDAARKGRVPAACDSLSRLMDLAPDDPVVPATVSLIRSAVEGARAKLLSSLGKAGKPKDVRALVRDLDALDRVVVGPGARLSAGSREALVAALDGFERKAERAALAAIPKIVPADVDFAVVANARLQEWARAWTLREATGLKAKKEYARGVELLGLCLAACPGDPELESRSREFAELERQARLADTVAAFQAGRTATGLLRARLDPRLGEADRQGLLREYTADIDALNSDLQLIAVLSPEDPFATRAVASLDGERMQGPGWRVALSEDGRKRLFPLQLRVRAEAVQNAPALMVRKESASQQYVSGTRRVDNPAKATCEADVERQRESVESSERSLDDIHQQAQECYRRAASAGGWGGALGGAACGAAEITAAALLGRQKSELNRASSECSRVPSRLEEKEYASRSYPVEFWQVHAAARLRIELVDARSGRPVTSATIEGTFSADDRVVRGQPEFEIPDDPMDLPASGEVEGRLLEDLRPKMVEACRAAAGEAWKVVAAEAPTSDGDRNEARARLAVLAESMAPAPAELAGRAREALEEFTKGLGLTASGAAGR